MTADRSESPKPGESADYERDVRELRQRLDPKSPEYAAAVLELQLAREARAFERVGKLGAIYRSQQRFAGDYYNLVASFYSGEIDDRTYKAGRIELLRDYAKRLHEVGLLWSTFDEPWIRDWAEAALAHERELLPVPATRKQFTDEDAATLCDPLREFSKAFFERVHAELGAGRLRDMPRIFGGVDAARCEEERRDLNVARKLPEPQT